MKEFKKINKESLSNRIIISRNIFLKGLSIVYLISFLSLYGQIQALWGNEGLFPSNLFLSKLKESLKGHKYYLFYPTIAWIFNFDSYSIENLLYVLCLLGIIISISIILFSEYFLNSISYFILWYIYYNFIILGQAFMRFAWDGLLTETGFISIFFCPFSFRYINYITQLNNISHYILKFILFKFMMSTGINIIGSQCPYWTSFNGLSFFFQGQPLLSSLSYSFHKSFGDTFKKILSAYGYFCILYLPIGYFLVWRRFNIYSGQITFLFNLFFIFSGNYGFLNLLVIVINTLNFDDYFYRSILSKNLLVKLKLDYLSPLVPIYLKEKKELNIEINKKEEEIGKIKNDIDKENEKKGQDKDEKKIKELSNEFNKLRREIMNLVDDDDFDDSPRIETTFKIESSIVKECFIFINFLCASLLLVYLLIYPIKRLVQGLSIIEQLPRIRFKSSVIFVSIYIFVYILLSFFINLVLKLKTSIFSESGIMNSVMNDIIESNKKKDENNNNKDIKDINEEFKKGLKKQNYFKIIFFALMNLVKVSKYMVLIIIFSVYFLGSVKYFLLNIDVELFEKPKTDSKEKSGISDEDSPGIFQNLMFLSDLLFSNYNAYGKYGNTQEEIQSVLGRSELEIEYLTENNKNTWRTINFKYKLGPENSNPKFLFFHTPRLDWKINFAAKDEDLNNDSWIILLLGKIFEKNPVVMDLLGYEIDDKKFLEKFSLFEKVKDVYFGRKKYELMPEISRLKVDIFKYQFLKNNEKKDKNAIFKRKRYKEYLSPIEKHTLLMVYEKLGLSKPDIKRKIKINKFQYIPVIDLVTIFALGILLFNKI